MLTAVILTKNEEHNIIGAINNAKLVASKVLVVDSGSIDRTVDLAKAAGADVVYRAWDNDFAAQRNYALKFIDTEWVLYLDADERLNDTLIEAIKKTITKKTSAIYQVERRNNAFGKEFKYGVLSSDSVKRMFLTKEAFWSGSVHEDIKTDLPIIRLEGYIKHYTYSDLDQYIKKMNLYSSIWAKETSKKANWTKDILLRPFLAFIKMYVLKLGFLEGWLGFLLCINYSIYTMNKYAKLKLKKGNENEKNINNSTSI